MASRTMTALAVALTAAIATPAAVAAPITDPVAAWVPDGEVKAVAVSGSTAYIGGNFTRIAPYTGSSARFDASNGQLKNAWPEVEGVVNAVAVDGAGGWYLGGDFRSVGGVPRTDLAHVLSNGSVDPSWAPTTDGTVRALAVANPSGPIYVGGEFGTVNGSARSHLAGLTRATGALTGFTGGVSASSLDFAGVHALLLKGTTLYVGGSFTQAQGSNVSAARNRVAAFTVASSVLAPWDPNANHTVNGLAADPDGTDIFISGRLNAVNNPQVARHGLAKVDEATGAADPNWVAPLQFGPELTSMTISGGWIYIGGRNIRFNPDPALQPLPAAAISVVGAVASPSWKPATPGAVTSLAAAGSTVYIGTGDLGNTPLGDGPHPGLIAVDAINATPTGFAPQFGRGRQQFPSGTTVGTRAIAVNGSDVVAGGTFINVGGVERRNLAAIDLNTGQATAFNPPMKGQYSAFLSVDAVAVTNDGVVWAGGEFATEAPNPRSNLAAFDATSGALTSFHRDPNGPVSALLASGPSVYVGGGFTAVGGSARHNVAALRHVPGDDGTVQSFDVATDGPVRALALAGDTLYLGGQFQNVNTALASLTRARKNAAAVDAATGLARAWDPNLDGPVNALAVSADSVFAGGEFANVNGSTMRQRLAAFDRQVGSARAWAPSADAPVRSLALHGPTVFAAGDFATVNGTGRRGIAALDAQTGAADPLSIDLSPEERDGPLPPITRVDALFASPATGLLTGGGFVMNTPTLRAANLARFGLPALPGGPPPGGPAPGGTNDVDPTLLSFSASTKRFRVGRRAAPADGQATAAAKRKRRKKAPLGTTLRLRLNEPARVRFRVLTKSTGRKVGKKCVKATRKNRKRKRCTKLTAKRPTFVRSAPAGRSKVKWSGRLHRKALRRGGYVLRAIPTDAAGNTGKSRSLSFKIVR
jgi:hypothetical protein